MLSEIFKSVLLMSFAGGILSLILLAVKPVTRKLFSPQWQYYIYLTVLLVMVLPVSFSLPQNSAEPAYFRQTLKLTDTVQITESETQPQTETLENPPPNLPIQNIDIPQNLLFYAGLIWLLGAVSALFVKLIRYTLFLKAIHKNSKADISFSNIPKRLKIRRTPMLDAPLLTGLIKPVLYLPETELSKTELDYIFMHELTHYKRHDILYKWAVMIVSSLHWFNPLIYAVSKQIDLECEVSCDFAVTSKLSEIEKNNYMKMILDMLSCSENHSRLLTTQMASGKKILKRRFTMIKTKKKTGRLMSVLSIFLAFSMLSASVFASGILSGLTEDNYTIEITNKGEVLELSNKPFIENGILYVPLREAIEKLDENAAVEWNDGSISVDIIGNRYLLFIGENAISVNPIIGPTFSVEADYSPILKGDVSYMPFDTLIYLFTYDQNNNYSFDFTIYDKNGTEISERLNDEIKTFR